MDVVVVGPAGLQSTMLRLQHRQLPLRFTVYPMIHLAEQSFYDDVCDRLRGHQLIVAEGIHGQGRDRHARLLTLTYRLAGQSSQLGLVVQSQAMLDIGVPVVYPDMSITEFGKRWRTLRWHERLRIWFLAPFYALYLRHFGSREFLARIAALDDDIAIDQASDSRLDRLIGDDRDAFLFDALTKIHSERGAEPIDVAIVYGAGHVLPIVAYLMARFGYVVRSAEWLTVFKL